MYVVVVLLLSSTLVVAYKPLTREEANQIEGYRKQLLDKFHQAALLYEELNKHQTEPPPYSRDEGPVGIHIYSLDEGEPLDSAFVGRQEYKFVVTEHFANTKRQYQTAITIEPYPKVKGREGESKYKVIVDCRFLPRLDDLSVLVFYAAKQNSLQTRKALPEFVNVELVKNGSKEFGRMRILRSNVDPNSNWTIAERSPGFVQTSISVSDSFVGGFGNYMRKVDAVIVDERRMRKRFYAAGNISGGRGMVLRLLVADKPISKDELTIVT